MAHIRDEFRFRTIGKLGFFLRNEQRFTRFHRGRDVLAGAAISLETARLVENRFAADRPPLLRTVLSDMVAHEIPERAGIDDVVQMGRQGMTGFAVFFEFVGIFG